MDISETEVPTCSLFGVGFSSGGKLRGTLSESLVPLDSKSWSMLILFINKSPATETVPGTYYMLSKYIMIEYFTSYNT